MKNKSFTSRLAFACHGIISAWQGERSFRAQVVLGLGAVGLLLYLQPAPIWWALFILVIGAVLAVELLNTALESVIDELHPEHTELLGRAKDCAAGAVLVLSVAAFGVLIALLVKTLD